MEDPIKTDTEFWRFLVQNGTLDPSLAEEFKARGRKEWRPLGQILVRRRALDMAQVMGLLAMQADEPNARLGDLAVREGMCTPEQIASALKEQRLHSPHPIELLLADDRVDLGGFFGPLVQYVRWLEGRVHTLSAEMQET
jgi:hypothetical protein